MNSCIVIFFGLVKVGENDNTLKDLLVHNVSGLPLWAQNLQSLRRAAAGEGDIEHAVREDGGRQQHSDGSERLALRPVECEGEAKSERKLNTSEQNGKFVFKRREG